jgi:hypothetical protein
MVLHVVRSRGDALSRLSGDTSYRQGFEVGKCGPYGISRRDVSRAKIGVKDCGSGSTYLSSATSLEGVSRWSRWKPEKKSSKKADPESALLHQYRAMPKAYKEFGEALFRCMN